MWDWLHLNRFWVMIVGIYVLKFLLLATVRPPVAGTLMGVVVLGLLPIIYSTADWTNPHMWSPLWIYIGQPVGVLTVPVLSFVFDLSQKKKGIQARRLTTILRLPIELGLLYVWSFLWTLIELMFGWFWI